MRGGTAAGIAVLGALATTGATDRSPAVSLAVGYSSPAALEHALHVAHGTLIRNLAPLRVAEVRGADARLLQHFRGIRFVQQVASRAEAGGPVLSTSASIAAEWQVQATRENAVPESVLRAAAGITIGVIDTGADVSAPDIAAKTPLTWNTRTGTADVRDGNGHGTFVASLAAGSAASGDRIGAGGDARLIVVKSGNDRGSFTDMDEAAGITYAIDHGAKILNLSIGGSTTSTTERRAVQYAIDHGALVVASVGNDYAPHDPVEYPAALLQPVGSNGNGGAGLAVTASTQDGRRAPFANTGTWISLAAPGVHVLGALSQLSSPLLYPRVAAPAGKGLYGYASGTSFAAPLVAGAAALVWAANPALTAQQVAQILKQTASGGGRWSPDLGFGVVDVAAAVAQAPLGPSGVLVGGMRDGTRERLTWSGTASPYTLTVARDGRTARTILAATPRTSATVDAAHGHTYVFTVTDGSGASAALTLRP